MAKDPFVKKPSSDPFKLRSPKAAANARADGIHQYSGSRICRTDSKGFATPKDLSPTELKLDAHEGFVPLWAEGVTLRWRFLEQSFGYFEDAESAKEGVRQLLREALEAWGNSVPVRFTEQRDAVDFEIVMQSTPDCDSSNRCTLAKAFFPDGGRHELFIFPQFFRQTRKEQVETLEHEFGHIFGLRHWFANISEADWRAEVFGSDGRFTIMNYGEDSFLTDSDKSDLKRLYDMVWAGNLKEVNGTPVRLFRPYSSHLYQEKVL